MLALIGGTNLGKSMLAADILMRIGGTLGTESFLEVTVEGSPHLDLTGFDHRFHSGVLLDGVVMHFCCVPTGRSYKADQRFVKGL